MSETTGEYTIASGSFREEREEVGNILCGEREGGGKLERECSSKED